jgi:hypothetical protein
VNKLLPSSALSSLSRRENPTHNESFIGDPGSNADSEKADRCHLRRILSPSGDQTAALLPRIRAVAEPQRVPKAIGIAAYRRGIFPQILCQFGKIRFRARAELFSQPSTVSNNI